MRLALFDLDNTLLGGDSDHAWGDYLCRRGILDTASYKTRNDEFHQDYLAGTLNMTDYLNFTLRFWARPRWNSWRNGTVSSCVTASNRSCCPRPWN